MKKNVFAKALNFIMVIVFSITTIAQAGPIEITRLNHLRPAASVKTTVNTSLERGLASEPDSPATITEAIFKILIKLDENRLRLQDGQEEPPKFDNERTKKLFDEFCEMRKKVEHESQVADKELDLILRALELEDNTASRHLQVKQEIAKFFMKLGNEHFEKGDFRMALRHFSHGILFSQYDSNERHNLTDLAIRTLNAKVDSIDHDTAKDFRRIWENPRSTIDELRKAINKITLIEEIANVPESSRKQADTVQNKLEQYEDVEAFLSYIDDLVNQANPAVTLSQFYERLNEKRTGGGKFYMADVKRFVDAYRSLAQLDIEAKNDATRKILWFATLILPYVKVFHGDESLDHWFILPKLLKKLGLGEADKVQIMALVTLYRNFSTLFFGEGSPAYNSEEFSKIGGRLKAAEEAVEKTAKETAEKNAERPAEAAEKKEKEDFPTEIIIANEKQLIDKFIDAIDNDDVYGELVKLRKSGNLVKLFPNLIELANDPNEGGLEKHKGLSMLQHSLDFIRLINLIEKSTDEARGKLNEQKVGRLIDKGTYEELSENFKQAIGGDKVDETKKNRRVLYIAALFHDLGTSKVITVSDTEKVDLKAPHEERGAIFIKHIMERMNYSDAVDPKFNEKDIRRAQWLIYHHVDLGTIHFGERTIEVLNSFLNETSPEKPSNEDIKLLALFNLGDLSIYKGEPASENKVGFFVKVLKDGNGYLEKAFVGDLLEYRIRIFSSNNKGELDKAKHEEAKRLLDEIKRNHNKDIYDSLNKNFGTGMRVKILDNCIFFFQALDAEALIKLLVLLSRIVDLSASASEWGDDGYIQRIDFTAKSAIAAFAAKPIADMLSVYTYDDIRNMDSLEAIKKELKASGLRVEANKRERRFNFDNKSLGEWGRHIKLAAIQAAAIVFSKATPLVGDEHLRSLTFLHDLSKYSVHQELIEQWAKVRLFEGFLGKDRQAIDLERALEEYGRDGAYSSLSSLSDIAGEKYGDEVANELTEIKTRGYGGLFNDFLKTVMVKYGIWNFRNIAKESKPALIRLLYMFALLRDRYPHDVRVLMFSHELDLDIGDADKEVFKRMLKALEDLSIEKIAETIEEEGYHAAPIFSEKLGLGDKCIFFKEDDIGFGEPMGFSLFVDFRPAGPELLPVGTQQAAESSPVVKSSSAGANIGILLDPGNFIKQGIIGDEAVNYRVKYKPTKTADEARAILKKTGALVYNGPLRGLDFGSSQDLQELKELLTPLEAKKLDKIAATTIFASKFRGSLKVEALPDEDKDKIVYVARIHGLTEENPRVFTEPLVKDENGVIIGGQKDAIGYILWNLFGITGVKVTYDLYYPGKEDCIGIERIPQVGGMGTSGNTNVGLLLMGSILSGAGLSIADCVAEATLLENTVFQGFTGGQEAYSTVLGKAYKAIWPGGIRDKDRNLRNHPYSTFAVPVCETEEDLRFIEDRTVLVQPGVRYEKVKVKDEEGNEKDEIEKMAHRSASSINTQWMKLAELKQDHTPLDPVGLSYHRNKIQHGNNQAQGAIDKNMELINKGNLGYVKERDKLCKRWMELILQGDESVGLKGPQTQWLEKLSISDRIGLATYVPKRPGAGLLTPQRAHEITEELELMLKKAKEGKEVTEQDYTNLNNNVIDNLKVLYANKISLYSDYAKTLIDAIKEVNEKAKKEAKKEAKKLVMSAIPLGAGGDGGIVAVFCAEGKEYLEKFLAGLDLPNLMEGENPGEVERIVTRDGGTLKGWIPYEIAGKGLEIEFEKNPEAAEQEGFTIPTLPELSVYDEETATYAKASSAGTLNLDDIESLNTEALDTAIASAEGDLAKILVKSRFVGELFKVKAAGTIAIDDESLPANQRDVISDIYDENSEALKELERLTGCVIRLRSQLTKDEIKGQLIIISDKKKIPGYENERYLNIKNNIPKATDSYLPLVPLIGIAKVLLTSDDIEHIRNTLNKDDFYRDIFGHPVTKQQIQNFLDTGIFELPVPKFDYEKVEQLQRQALAALIAA